MGFTIIDGNIKQQMLPFLLNPDSDLNKKGDSFRSTNNSFSADAQYFTFRNNDKYMISGTGKLNFCPSTMKDFFNNDISYQLTYKYNQLNKDKPTESVTFDSLLDNVPAIQIREFLPDTALEQAINFFIQLIKEVMSLFGDEGMMNAKSIQDSNKNAQQSSQATETGSANTAEKEQSDSFFDKIWNVTWFIMKYITGVDMESKESFPDLATAKYTEFDESCTFTSTAPHYAQILKLPHMLYYRLQSCTTTGIYELPSIPTSKRLYSSDGTPGWGTAGYEFLPPALKGIPILGDVLGKMFGNVRVSFMPWWDSSKGNAAEPEIEVKIDLFNDTNEAALINFIFVNTLIPNNKFIQYGLFQHSPHLYDIKLEGYNRLFACTGKFDVTYEGVLREPPPNWYQLDGPLSDHINKNIDTKQFLEKIKTNKLIKIPDIYRVTMTFNSLIPANFNNYLYTLVMNDNIIDSYYYKTRDESLMASALVNSFTGLLTGAKNAFTKSAETKYQYVPKGLELGKKEETTTEIS